MSCGEIRPLLIAFRDGDLDTSRTASVELHLKECPACLEEFEAMAKLGGMIRDARFPAPSNLPQNVIFAIRNAEYTDKQSHSMPWRGWAIAAAGILVAGLAWAPFAVNARSERQALATEMVSAHERALAGRETDVVSTDRHTVKPWFNGKLPFSPPVADLSAKGFPLEGGRLDYVAGRPVAVLVYARRLHRIDVFVWPADSGKPPAHSDRNGFHEISWTKNDFVLTCVSDLDPVELSQFVELMRNQ